MLEEGSNTLVCHMEQILQIGLHLYAFLIAEIIWVSLPVV